jgi:hypothetical protein
MECLEEIRQWPGCEAIGGVEVFHFGRGKFIVRVMDYGGTPFRIANQAAKCIEREKRRHYHLKD